MIVTALDEIMEKKKEDDQGNTSKRPSGSGAHLQI